MLSVGIGRVPQALDLVAVVTVDHGGALARCALAKSQGARPGRFWVGLTTPGVVVIILLAVDRITADDHVAGLRQP